MNWNRPNYSGGVRAWTGDKKVNKHGHETHELKRVKTDNHFGKLICITCNNKFVKWLSQDEYFKYK